MHEFIHFLAILSSEQSGLDSADTMGIISAQWANEMDVMNLFSKSPYLADDVSFSFINSLKLVLDEATIKELNDREIQLEMRLKKERSFHRSELIFDPRKLGELANLHYSMEWFVGHISKLRLAGNAPQLNDNSRSWVKENMGSTELLASLNGIFLLLGLVF